MGKLFYKAESRKEFYQEMNNPENSLSREQITLGAMLRIADATELMAKNFQEMQTDRDMYKRWYNEECERNNFLIKRNRALRGHITRLKNRIKKHSGPKFI
jgi:predicted nuclease with TOPRIM domain